MLKRILSFIGWGIAGFFALIALTALSSGQFRNSLWIILWALIFVPPLYQLTNRFGNIWNIVGRLVVFILAPIVFISPTPQPEAMKSPGISTQPVVVSPAQLPTPSPQNPTPEPSPTPTPTNSPISKAVVEEKPSPTPALVESPIPKPAVKEKPSPIPTPITPPTPKPLVRPKPLAPEKPLSVEKKESQPVTPKPKATAAPPKRENPVPSGLVIPEQSGNCKDLRAKGISNIDVKVNPWASDLDRDDDGVACESR
ncbi:MAG: excalibur calcium-binding domain-containing protein [Scytonematopsis contorta HA4267-MV1]|jgi:cytoskeletal protein RodZ|nr:excalibur calcium-binding domain-containing protein [Scytonematopsis contorta HA4267-MV1]